MCYHRSMRPLCSRPRAADDAGAGRAPLDALAEARRLYNQGQYERPSGSRARQPRSPRRADAARVVLGRIQLERYRQTADRAISTMRARVAAHGGRRRRSTPRERVELPSASPRRCTSRIGSARPPSCSNRARSGRRCSARPRTSACSTGGRPRSIARRRRDCRKSVRRSTRAHARPHGREEIRGRSGSAAAGYWLAAAATRRRRPRAGLARAASPAGCARRSPRSRRRASRRPRSPRHPGDHSRARGPAGPQGRSTRGAGAMIERVGSSSRQSWSKSDR